MRKIQISFLLISILLFACNNEIKISPEKIKMDIDTISINYGYDLKDVVQFEDKYIIQNDDSYEGDPEFRVLDRNFKIDEKLSKSLNFKDYYFQSIWVTNDTLYANDLDYFSNDSTVKHRKYFFTLKTKKWILESEKTTKRKFYSSLNFDLDIPIFEDTFYRIRAISSGEFGGSVYFFDKKTKKTFACPSYSTKNIFKINKSYFIINSLAHMGGSTEIYKIDDPQKMYLIKDKEQIENSSWAYNQETYKTIKGCFNGVKTIIDTLDIMSTASFVRNNNIYCIYSDGKKTFLGFVKDKKIIKIKKILDKVTYYSKIRNIKSNPNLFPIRSREINGFYIIQDTVIKIISLK